MEVAMNSVLFRRIIAVLTVGLGIAQAFDSGIRMAPPAAMALAALAVAIPAAAFWFSADRRVQLGSAVVAGVLTVLARAVSPVALPTLSLIAFFPALAAILAPRVPPVRQGHGTPSS
jgi:hypothetical protein